MSYWANREDSTGLVDLSIMGLAGERQVDGAAMRGKMGKQSNHIGNPRLSRCFEGLRCHSDFRVGGMN